MKHILVTGGAGFIGSHTVDLLLQSGFHVTVMDNLASGKLANLDLFHPNLRVEQRDILDYPTLLTLIKRCDAVLHLAAIPSVPRSVDDPIATLGANLQGFVHVLQAVRESQKSIRIVYASSAATYGDASELPCNDDIAVVRSVTSPYALEKASNEQYATLFARLFGLSCLGLRYFNVYGARQDPSSPYSGVISKFLSCYSSQQPLTLFGDGKQSRDFIYVADVARANLLALQSDYTGTLNIATGRVETLLDLIHCMETIGERALEVQFSAARVGDIRESYATTAKAEQHLKFRATTSLLEGMRVLIGEQLLKSV